MADIVFYFQTNADTMVATKTLKDAGIAARLIAKPPSVSSASNLCLSIAPDCESAARSALHVAKLQPFL